MKINSHEVQGGDGLQNEKSVCDLFFHIDHLSATSKKRLSTCTRYTCEEAVTHLHGSTRKGEAGIFGNPRMIHLMR